MSAAAVQRSLWVNVLWTGGLALLVLALVAGSIYRLRGARSTVQGLSASVAEEELQVSLLPDIEERRAALAEVESQLDQWSELVESAASRIQELSAAAGATGVKIVSLGSFQPGVRDNGRVITSSHKLVALGDYQELASFLDAAYSARGMLAVDELQIEPDGRRATSKLRASMTVVWSTIAEAPEAEEGAE